jgi:cytochrome c peroxidase
MTLRIPFVCFTAMALAAPKANAQEGPTLDEELQAVLLDAGFTGNIQSTLQDREHIGRLIDFGLANLGRLLWFDTVLSLHDDTSCASCHSPTHGWGDTQSIAIGVQSNLVVGPNRQGPRNLRRSPMTTNAAFYPTLMWDGRFWAPSGNPFDNSQGFAFPPPEGTEVFPPNDKRVTHLLTAQAFLPPTVLEEMAGFTGTAGTLGEEFDVFDDGLGTTLPAPDESGFRNHPIRKAVLDRLNAIPEYVFRFGTFFPGVEAGDPIDFSMVGRALAEFQFLQVRANAPIDRYARGDLSAMTDEAKRGALVFFGNGECVGCHAVAGASNEMFSDFRNHVIAVPQVASRFGEGRGNVPFDGDAVDEDFGLERTTLDPADRYMFRTAPLRNVALAPAFFHNGAFTELEDAIRHHLDVERSLVDYDPDVAGVDVDLTRLLGGAEPMLERLDPLLATPISLTEDEITDLVTFVRDALLDPRSLPANLCKFVPDEVPSGAAIESFPLCSLGVLVP